MGRAGERKHVLCVVLGEEEGQEAQDKSAKTAEAAEEEDANSTRYYTTYEIANACHGRRGGNKSE